jgi:alpha-beta hydrolase superfamily lysophospholipase
MTAAPDADASTPASPAPAAPDDAATAVEPDAPTLSLGTARMADGTTLRTLHWEPATEPWALAEIVHGLGEHGGRYVTVAGALTTAGIDTWSYDHRGNGGSGGRRGHIDRWATLHDDLEARIDAVRATRPGLPLVLWGHSLGGMIACGYVLSGKDRPLPDVLVLSAPSLDDDVAGWKRSIAPIAARVVPHMRVPHDLPKGGLSRDPQVEARTAIDPMCGTSSTTRFGAEAFAEQERLRGILTGLDAMPVPTYVFHGAADPIVPVRASAVFEGMGNVTRVTWPGLRHETHHEPEHGEVLGAVVDWLRSTVPGAPRV